MIYAMEKSIESLSKPKWWTTIVAVGSLAISPFVGSCSAESQSPKPAPEASTTAAAASTAPGDWLMKLAKVIQFGLHQLLIQKVRVVITAVSLYVQLSK